MDTSPEGVPIRAAIFDVDGTLIDSNDLHIEAWREAFRRYGKDLGYDEIHAQMGKGGDQLMPVFLSRHEIDKFGEDLEHMRGDLFIRNYLPRAQPFPGVRALFERLSADGIRIALASSAKEEELLHHMKTLKIEDLLEGATSADDAEHSKPSPDIFVAALGRLKGVSSEEAIVVGDTPYDAEAAAKAGMRTVGVLSGGFSAERLRRQGVIAVYGDIEDLLKRYDASPFARENIAR